MLPDAIVMMEDHDKAYYAWKEHNVRARTLVHIDAHIDFGWIPEIDFEEIGCDRRSFSCLLRGSLLLNPFLKPRGKMVNIGNYICPAIREGMVNKFYWVVPDESWESSRGRKHIIKQLRQLLKIKIYSGGKLEKHRDHIRCRIMDTDLIVCSLENLERIEAPVLLDIDVDFMLTKHIWDDLNPERFPWIFPEELYEKIAFRISSIDVLTIAYSVEGGFTPLKFKYLGDELRCFFQGTKPKSMDHKRKAVYSEIDKKLVEAAASYEEALKADDSDASIYYNLALLYLDEASGKAASFYNEAVSRDRSYSTSYNNYGILYLQYNKPKTAAIEYEKFLAVDENNAAVLNGLGCVALAQRRYTKALKFFDRCLAVDNKSPAARSGKAIVSFKKGALAEAEQLFTGLKRDHADDAEPYWWLGRIAQKNGEISAAIDHYKDAVMRGGEGPMVHLLLARLYIMKKFYFRAIEESERAFHALRTLS